MLSNLRVLLIPVLWVLALLGEGRLLGLGLLLAGATDYLDGLLARRLKQESAAGARLDALADNLLLVSATMWPGLLYPQILRDNGTLLIATFAAYAASWVAALLRHQPRADLHLYSAKAAGGCLYGFAVITLVTGFYLPPLLWVAAGAVLISCVERLCAFALPRAADENVGSIVRVLTRRVETRTVQDSGTARKMRSQAPQPANLVGSSTSATTSSAIAARPSPSDTRS